MAAYVSDCNDGKFLKFLKMSYFPSKYVEWFSMTFSIIHIIEIDTLKVELSKKQHWRIISNNFSSLCNNKNPKDGYLGYNILLLDIGTLSSSLQIL